MRTHRALTIAFVSFLLLAFSLKTSSEFSRMFIAVSYAAALVGLGVVRFWIAGRASSLLGGNPWDTILICDGGTDLSVPADCNLVLHAGGMLSPLNRSPEMFDQFARSIGKADRVVVRCPAERRAAWMAVLQGLNVQGEIQASELRHLAPQALSFSGSEPTIVVAQGPLAVRERILKRIVDICISGVAILLLLPVFAAAAAAIRLTSPGPVFFKQVRVGRQNRKFTMFKFRSMYIEKADFGGVNSASRDDSRITPVGRWLRRTSMDELPQLLNVLLGDMSIVGPRPHALSSTAADLLFWEIDPTYWNRHVIKPGLTGLAQVRGFRGATLQRDDLERRLNADMEYIRNWSLQLDFLILIRTAMVLVHRNAY
ncbi:sugar transferase [Sphingomonas sp. 3-13AW]|uniref:sugar transferase n=1 Tax=Sphingomonas sp. 3-13AW TaxID=3050450 RepID=UPI003BB4F41D